MNTLYQYHGDKEKQMLRLKRCFIKIVKYLMKRSTDSF